MKKFLKDLFNFAGIISVIAIGSALGVFIGMSLLILLGIIY